MENAANAVGKLFGSADSKDSNNTTNSKTTANHKTTMENKNTKNNTDSTEADTSVHQEVKPAVEHEHVKKTHETEEQKFVEKERHQDHYHTTVQPLKDSEVRPEKHDQVQEKEYKEFNHDDSAAKAKAKADQAGFSSSKDEQKFEAKTTAPTQVTENVHHHLHETIQPVIEKGKLVIICSVWESWLMNKM